MMAKIATLVRWEWFKLQRRRMLWVLLAFALLFGQIAVWGSFYSYQNLTETGGEVTVPASVLPQDGQQRRPRTVACNDLLSDDPARQPADLAPQVLEGLRTTCSQQAAQLPGRLGSAYQDFSPPGSVPNAIGILQTLGLILIAILTASAIGIDYGTGTLRSALTQGTGRWPYLAAKLATLAGLAALGLLIATASVIGASLIAAALAGTAPAAAGVSPATWTDAGLAVWKAWVSFLPYIALTACVTVVARSTAAGMAIGLGYYFGEQIIASLLTGFFSWFADVAAYLPVHNISAWTGGSGGFGPPAGGDADPVRALVVLAVYTLTLGGIAFWLFERRDVQGATGGG
jgi:ABC-type transport system involved in multi-copper enzyme maturation permease subunit